MAPFLYLCPTTGFRVQSWTEDEPNVEDTDVFISVSCLACNKVHLVNPKTGRVANGLAE